MLICICKKIIIEFYLVHEQNWRTYMLHIIMQFFYWQQFEFRINL